MLTLIQETTQVYNTVKVISTEQLCNEYSEICNEATVNADSQAPPKFHHYWQVPFAVKKKVEKTLRAQVAEES